MILGHRVGETSLRPRNDLEALTQLFANGHFSGEIAVLFLSLSKAAGGKLPEMLIPISDDGCGVAYYIDASKQHENSCEVVAYGPGINGDAVAASLEEFVLKMAG